MATKSVRSQAFLLGTRLVVDRQSEGFHRLGVDFYGCLRHNQLKGLEFTRVLRWYRLRGVVCLERR